MIVIDSAPVKTFLGDLGKTPTHTLKLAFPYITNPLIMNLIIPKFKRKQTKIKLCTNLSPFNVAISLNNPCDPLINLYKAFNKRIEIKSNSTIHGKIMIADKRRVLFGSSNLTNGGELTNWEINSLISNKTKEDKELIEVLANRFDKLYSVSTVLTIEQLKNISNNWEKENKLRTLILGVLPEPRLGDNYWQKVIDIANKTKLSQEDAKNIINKNDPEHKKEPKNFERKLIFLQELGVVKYWDKDWIYVSDTAMDIIKSPGVFYQKLRQIIPATDAVLKIIYNKEKTHYAYLDKKLQNEYTINTIHTAANWLEHINFIKREKSKNSHAFTLLDLGKGYLHETNK